MMKNLIKFIFFMSILALNLSAENFDNLKKLQQLFTDVNFDKNAFFKGEQRRNLDINYAQNAKHYKVLVTRIGQSDDFNDIFRVSLQSEKPWRDALGTRYEWQDLYFYAKNDGIYAQRKLAQTDILRNLFYFCSKVDTQQKCQSDIENLSLILAPDSYLHEFGALNLNKFEQIFELFAKDETGAKKLAHELHFDTIQNENGLFLLVLGGVTDNSVGFMRTQNPPQMDGRSYIMIEHIFGAWYLYKTT